MLGYQAIHPVAPTGQHYQPGRHSTGLDYMTTFGLSPQGQFMGYTSAPPAVHRTQDFTFRFNLQGCSSFPVDGYSENPAASSFQCQNKPFELGGTGTYNNVPRSTEDSDWFADYINTSALGDGQPFVEGATLTAPVDNAFGYATKLSAQDTLFQSASGAFYDPELGLVGNPEGAWTTTCLEPTNKPPSASPEILDFSNLEIPTDIGISVEQLEELGLPILPFPFQAPYSPSSGFLLSPLGTAVAPELNIGSWAPLDGQYFCTQSPPAPIPAVITLPSVPPVFNYLNSPGAQSSGYQGTTTFSVAPSPATFTAHPGVPPTTATASTPAASAAFVHYHPQKRRARVNAQAGSSTRAAKRRRQDANSSGTLDDGKAARNVSPRVDKDIYYVRCPYPSHEGSMTRCGEFIEDRSAMQSHIRTIHPSTVVPQVSDPKSKELVCAALVPYWRQSPQGHRTLMMRKCGCDFDDPRSLFKHIFAPVHFLEGGKEIADKDGKAMGNPTVPLPEAMIVGCPWCPQVFEQYFGGEGTSAKRHAQPSTTRRGFRNPPACKGAIGSKRAKFVPVPPEWRDYEIVEVTTGV